MTRLFIAAGQLWSTVVDLARWAAFLGGDTGDILAKDTLEEMCVVQAVNDQLTELIGASGRDLVFAPNGTTVILMAGLQGSGKTTSCAKLAASGVPGERVRPRDANSRWRNPAKASRPCSSGWVFR